MGRTTNDSLASIGINTKAFEEAATVIPMEGFSGWSLVMLEQVLPRLRRGQWRDCLAFAFRVLERPPRPGEPDLVGEGDLVASCTLTPRIGFLHSDGPLTPAVPGAGRRFRREWAVTEPQAARRRRDFREAAAMRA